MTDESPKWLDEVAAVAAQRWADAIDEMALEHVRAEMLFKPCTLANCVYCDRFEDRA